MKKFIEMRRIHRFAAEVSSEQERARLRGYRAQVAKPWTLAVAEEESEEKSVTTRCGIQFLQVGLQAPPGCTIFGCTNFTCTIFGSTNLAVRMYFRMFWLHLFAFPPFPRAVLCQVAKLEQELSRAREELGLARELHRTARADCANAERARGELKFQLSAAGVQVVFMVLQVVFMLLHVVFMVFQGVFRVFL